MSETVIPNERDAAGGRPMGDSRDAAPAGRVHVTRSRAKPGGTAQVEGAIPFKRARKPPWLKVPAPGGPNYRRLKEKIGATGVNVLSNAGRASGQEIFHFHVHILPRYPERPGMAALASRDDNAGDDLDGLHAALIS